MRTILALLAAAIIAGCGDQPQEKQDSNKKPVAKKSAGSSLINDLTGKTAVDQGRKAQESLKKSFSKENENLDEVLGK